MSSPFMRNLIDNINNNSPHSNFFKNHDKSNPIIEFSSTINHFKVHSSSESVNNENDKIKEFLIAKRYICNSEIKKTKFVKHGINEISKFIKNKTPMILNMEYNLTPKGLCIPLYSEMELNIDEYYNKIKYITLSSIDFKDNDDHKDTFKYLYPMILINYYKFLVTRELLPKSKNDPINVMNILIKLTSLSCSRSRSLILPIDSPREHVNFQSNLMLPFDWSFCEELINFFEYSFVIINANDNSTICYKPNYIREKKYVIIKYKSRCDLTLYYKSF